jgi:hypothetical protein
VHPAVLLIPRSTAGARKEQSLPSAAWLSWSFAGVMILTALYHVGRLVAVRQPRRHTAAESSAAGSSVASSSVDVDVTHTAMGVGMAGMLVGWLTPGASHWWALGFAVPTVWFASHAARSSLRQGPRGEPAGQHVRQALSSGSMVFMLGAVALTAGTAGAVGSAGPAAAASSDSMASMSGMAGMTGMTGMTGTSGMGGMVMPHLGGAVGGNGVSWSRLADVLLTVAMVGVAVWTAVLLVRAVRARRAGHRSGAPAWGTGCQLAMNVTTVYMLALML